MVSTLNKITQSNNFLKLSVKQLINPLKEIQATFVNAPIHALNAINRLTNSKEIEEQEYTCLTLTFYMNGLSQFLGLSEE